MSYGARKDFYKSRLWKQVKNNIWLKQSCLCAICHRPVYVDGISDYIPREYRRTGIVHHKVFLNDVNLDDENISIAEDNLEGVCKDCHEKLHHTDVVTRQGYIFDEEGNLRATPPQSSI